jgi:hypothetical protein
MTAMLAPPEGRPAHLQDAGPVPVEPEPPTAGPLGGTTPAGGLVLHAAARAEWARCAESGRPLSGAALGRKYGMSERWGRDRAAEARAAHPHLDITDPAAPGTTATGKRPGSRRANPEQGTAARGAQAPATPNRAMTGALPLVSTPRDTQPATAPLSVAPLAAATAVPFFGSPAAAHDGTGTTTTAPVVISARQRRRSALGAAAAMTPGLVISWWSFTAYLRSGGTPVWLACLASFAVDGLAAYAALYATWFVDHGLPARTAKTATYGMVVISTLVNWSHAVALHWGLGQRVALAIPAVSAAVALELALMRLSVVARSKRERRRRTRMAAQVDRDLWLQHPVKVWRYRRAEGLRRLAEVFDH